MVTVAFVLQARSWHRGSRADELLQLLPTFREGSVMTDPSLELALAMHSEVSADSANRQRHTDSEVTESIEPGDRGAWQSAAQGAAREQHSPGNTLSKTSPSSIAIPQSAKSALAMVEPLQFGIDWITFRVPVDLSLCDPYSDLWRGTAGKVPKSDLENLKGKLKVGSGTIDVTLYTYESQARIQLNPSRFISDDAYDLCPTEALPALVEGVLNGLMHAIHPRFVRVDDDGVISWDQDWQDQVWISRLDVARNLVIDDADSVKRVLEQVVERYRKRHTTYEQGSAGWGLVNSAATVGQEKIYDKDAERGRKAKPAYEGQPASTRRMRFEVELKRDRLDRYGLRQLSTITAERCWTALAERWEASRWGTPLSAGGAVYDATRQLDASAGFELIGYLTAAADRQISHVSKSALRRLNRVAAQCGLTPGVPLMQWGPPTHYIDLAAGQLLPLKSNAPLTGATESLTEEDPAAA